MTVEAVLVLPLLVATTLGILQLAMVQHARVMTEYAAFQAARAGIVWSGSNARMRDAALLALAPTLGRTDGPQALTRTHAEARLLDAALAEPALAWGGPRELNGTRLAGLVRVDTLNPVASSTLDTLWNLARPGRGARWEELDLDGADAFPEAPGLDAHLDELFDLAHESPAATAYRRATVLSIRLRYWYELRIPLANWLVFHAWMGTRGGPGIVHARGLPTLDVADRAVLERLADGGLPGVEGGGIVHRGRRFFLPLTATYSMRMQSNFHRKWLMHAEGDDQAGAGTRAAGCASC